jgi:hypothetical protein
VTLKTSVAIGVPTDVVELFQFCRVLVDTPDGAPFDHEACSDWRPGQRQILNHGGIGADAWLWIYYGADGPIPPHAHDEFCSVELGGKYDTTQEQIDEHAAWVAADPTENGWAAIEVTFDTAYSYRGDNGEGCSDLHARIVTALGQWLDAKGLPWKWQNEYSGEWFDRYDGLAEFGDAHRATGADAWFRSQVLPAITSLGGTP